MGQSAEEKERDRQKKAEGDRIMAEHRRKMWARGGMSAQSANEQDLINRQHGYDGSRGFFGGKPPVHPNDRDEGPDTSFLGLF
jgi:hypothetical protein